MKSFYKYIAIILAALLIGITSISLYTQNILKDKIIELQENVPDTAYVDVHDTIVFDSIVLKWKTKHDTTETYIVDTLVNHDTITIVKEKIMQPDTFQTSSRWTDSIIDATIFIQGTGIPQNTTLDSISLDYLINTEVLIPKKKCSWWRKFWCGCE